MSIVEPFAPHVADEEQGVPQDDNSTPALRDADDGDLLRQFVSNGDDLVFAQLVTRHAELVMGVCRRALGNEQDAEDAFQATFLVLARKAATVRQGKSLPTWLYQTAYRIALRARAGRAQRKEKPLEAETMTDTDAFSYIANEHDQTVLDEELNRLPEKYRLPLFLCCVEGKSRDEAAKQLGLSSGALKGRLERGRHLLRRRLLLRGVSLSVAMGVMAGLQQTTQAAQVVAPSLIASTVQAGVQYAAGKTALGFVSLNALTLANGSFQIMSWTTTKIVACCLLLLGALAVVSNSAPLPAMAGGAEGETIVLTAQAPSAANSETAVAFLADDEREGQRRSAEGEGQRRSPEAEAGPRRSAEGDRGPRRSAEGEGSREAANPLQGFRPQTQREAALFQMIQQLQREVAALRRMVQAQEGSRRYREGEGSRPEGEARRESPSSREGGPSSQPSSAQAAKFAEVFRTYDKNGNGSVSFEERLAMKNFEVTGQRLLNEKLYHLAEDLNRDGGVSLEEFAAYRSQERRQGWIQARLLDVDATKGLITVESRGGEGQSTGGKQSIRVEPKAVIAVKGQETKLGALRTGQPIYLFMSHDNQSAIGLTQR